MYQVRKPRIKVSYEEGPRKAELDEAGEPVFPPGFPHCRRDDQARPIAAVQETTRVVNDEYPDVRRSCC